MATDIRAPRDGRYIERLGTYNPMKEKDDPDRVSLNLERIKYWLSVGANPTERVTGFLAKEGLLKNREIPKQTKQDKPKKKTVEKLKAKEEKLKAKEEMEKAVENVPDTQAQEAKSEAQPAEAASPPAEGKPVEEAKSEAKPAEAASPPAEDKPVEEAKSEANLPKQHLLQRKDGQKQTCRADLLQRKSHRVRSKTCRSSISSSGR